LPSDLELVHKDFEVFLQNWNPEDCRRDQLRKIVPKRSNMKPNLYHSLQAYTTGTAECYSTDHTLRRGRPQYLWLFAFTSPRTSQAMFLVWFYPDFQPVNFKRF